MRLVISVSLLISLAGGCTAARTARQVRVAETLPADTPPSVDADGPVLDMRFPDDPWRVGDEVVFRVRSTTHKTERVWYMRFTLCQPQPGTHLPQSTPNPQRIQLYDTHKVRYTQPNGEASIWGTTLLDIRVDSFDGSLRSLGSASSMIPATLLDDGLFTICRSINDPTVLLRGVPSAVPPESVGSYISLCLLEAMAANERLAPIIRHVVGRGPLLKSILMGDFSLTATFDLRTVDAGRVETTLPEPVGRQPAYRIPFTMSRKKARLLEGKATVIDPIPGLGIVAGLVKATAQRAGNPAAVTTIELISTHRGDGPSLDLPSKMPKFEIDFNQVLWLDGRPMKTQRTSGDAQPPSTDGR